mgnify:FL=1|tara:strand:+ start:350 stop:721 length:372 start_codon:yes stop_codon:yes gene_type:complete
MQTQNLAYNLVATNNSFSSVHTQSVLKQFKRRHKFAKLQQLSKHVTCTSIYTDDVDICFVFNVVHNNTTYTVDVYANYNKNYVSGNVYNCNLISNAIDILKQHFNLNVTVADNYTDEIYFNAK